MVPAYILAMGVVQDTLQTYFVNHLFLVLNPSMNLTGSETTSQMKYRQQIFAAKKGMYSEQQNHACFVTFALFSNNSGY